MDAPPAHVRLILHMLQRGDAASPPLVRAQRAMDALFDAQRRLATREELLGCYREAIASLEVIRNTQSHLLTSQLAHKGFARDACAWLEDLSSPHASRAASALGDTQVALEQHMEAIALDLTSRAPIACNALQCILGDKRRFAAASEEGEEESSAEAGRRDMAAFASACAGTLLVVLVAMLLNR